MLGPKVHNTRYSNFTKKVPTFLKIRAGKEKRRPNPPQYKRKAHSSNRETGNQTPNDRYSTVKRITHLGKRGFADAVPRARSSPPPSAAARSGAPRALAEAGERRSPTRGRPRLLTRRHGAWGATTPVAFAMSIARWDRREGLGTEQSGRSHSDRMRGAQSERNAHGLGYKESERERERERARALSMARHGAAEALGNSEGRR